MKKALVILTFLVAIIGFMQPSVVQAYNYSDVRSSALISKAWGAFSRGDSEAVLAYTNKTIELYAEEAIEMQSGLDDFPKGSNDKIFSYWALNDVGTGLYLKAEAFKKAGKFTEAKQAYNDLIRNFYYAQCWDPNGWFWKPAKTAMREIKNLDVKVAELAKKAKRAEEAKKAKLAKKAKRAEEAKKAKLAKKAKKAKRAEEAKKAKLAKKAKRAEEAKKAKLAEQEAVRDLSGF